MKIKVMSDLHLDINASLLSVDKSLLEEEFISYLLDKRKEYDMILIVGDLSDNMLYSLNILERLQKTIQKPVKFVPGNHDVYKVHFGTVSMSSDHALQLYERSSFSLVKPYSLTDKTVLIGTLGWYDYSFILNHVKPDEVDDKELDILHAYYEYWNDSTFVNFNRLAPQISADANKQYEEWITQFHNKDIFIANHFVPFLRYIKFTNDPIWNVCNAFIGSEELGNMIEKHKQVKYVAFGHTHSRYGVNQIGHRTEVCVPLGYVDEWNEEYIKLSMVNPIEAFRKELNNTHTVITVC